MPHKEKSHMTHAASKSLRAIVKGLALCAIIAGGRAAKAQPTPKVVLPPSVEGDWVRTDENGSGSYEGLDKFFPQASLTPEGEKLLAQFGRNTGVGADISKKVGTVYVVRPHPCVFNGGFGGGLEFNSAGFH